MAGRRHGLAVAVGDGHDAGEEDYEISPFDQWLENDMRGVSDRPQAVFVALAGREVVGFAKQSLPTAWTGRKFHDMAGVKRAWRRHGIGAALKRGQTGWANTRYGYRIEPGRVLLRAAIEATL